MLRQIKYKTKNGEIDIGQGVNSPFLLVGVEGLGYKNNIHTTKSIYQDGENFISSDLQMRNILIRLAFKEDLQANTDKLFNIFSPKTEGSFYYFQGQLKRRANCYVESIDIKENKGVKTALISLISPEPFFNDLDKLLTTMATWNKAFCFPNPYISKFFNVNLEGNTLKNELSYNPNTWAEWTKSTGVVGDSTGLEFTADTTKYVYSYLNVNFKPNTNYGVLLNILSNNTGQHLAIDGSSGQPFGMNWGTAIGNVKAVKTSIANITLQTFRFAIPPNETSGLKIKIKDVRVYELPPNSQIETDFNTLSADQLVVKYPFASGISSVGESGSFKIISRGKNLLNSEDKKKFYINGGTPFQLVANNNTTSLIIPYPPIGVELTFNKYIGDRSSIATYNNLESYEMPIEVIGIGVPENKTFKLSKPARYLVVYLNSTFGDVQAQIEEGTTATPYEPYQSHTITVPTELRAIGNVKDEIKNNVLTRRVGKVVLNGSENDWRVAKGFVEHFYIPLSGINGKSQAEQILISDTLPNYAAYWNSLSAINTISTSSIFNFQIGFTFELGKFETVEAFKAWLQANPTTVLYELATPTTEVMYTNIPNDIVDRNLYVASEIQPSSINTTPNAAAVFGVKNEEKIKNVTNNGNVETPVSFIFQNNYSTQVIKPKITNVVTREFFEVAITLEKGDRLIIDTENKLVTLNGINVFNKRVRGSSFFNLNVGDNYLQFDAEQNADNLEVMLEYNSRYLGV